MANDDFVKSLLSRHGDEVAPSRPKSRDEIIQMFGAYPDFTIPVDSSPRPRPAPK